MTSTERKKYILKTAAHEGMISIPELAAHFDVSVETIRRDVNALCNENKLTKVHGGAVPVGKNTRRNSVSAPKKAQIDESAMTVGSYCASLIKNGDVVMFDSGDCAQLVAHALNGLRDVTLITNSVSVAAILLDKYLAGDFTGRVIMIGGDLNLRGRFSCSPDAFDQLGKYYSDVAFITASAVSHDGVSSQDSYGSKLSAIMAEHSSCPVLVTESEKFGHNSLAKFAPISAFKYIVTDGDNALPDKIADMIAKSSAVFRTFGTK